MIPFRTADSKERGFRSGSRFGSHTGFRGGSTGNIPGAGTAKAPSATAFNKNQSGFRPAPQVNPTQVFSNLITQAQNFVRPFAGKVGPRGATIQDVQQVAETGVAPVRPATRTPAPTAAPTVAPIDQSAVLSGMIGGPSPTFGQRYGGLSSGTQFDALVRGDYYNMDLARQMAQAEAERLAAPIEEQYAIDVDPTKVLGMAGRNLRGAEKILGTGTPTMIGRRTVNVGALQNLARQMAGGGTPTEQDMYAANMARMNAARGTGDFPIIQDQETGIVRPTTIEEQIAANASERARLIADPQRERDLRLFGATRAQELADAMNIPASEMMQRIAIEKYGYDPALAAGLFPVSENLDYQRMLMDAAIAEDMRNYGVDPGMTVAETILLTQGPEAMRQYQLQQADYAMNGTPTQQLSALKNEQEADDALFDEQARTEFGIDPGRVSGVDPDYMRSLLEDENFVTFFTQARNAIVDGADPLEEASRASADYARKSGDMLGATAMSKILASFDLQSFG